MIEVTVRCCWCNDTATAYGPSTWPTVPKGWNLDTRNLYSAQAHHFCPQHTSGRPRRY